MSASLIPAFGGIGTAPQAPEPPSFTFFDSFATASLSLLYLAATSTYDGPTSFLSIAWQSAQLSFFINASAAALSSTAWAAPAVSSAAAAAIAGTAFIEAPKSGQRKVRNRKSYRNDP